MSSPTADESIKNIYSRTLSCLNDYLYRNLVPLKNFSEDFLNLSVEFPEMKGARYPVDLFTVKFITELGLPVKPGLFISSPGEEPTYGWFVDEYVDILLSCLTTKSQEVGSRFTTVERDNIKAWIEYFKKHEELQKKIILLNRTKGLLDCAKLIQDISRQSREGD